MGSRRDSKLEANSSAYKKLRRFIIANKHGGCPICPPHGGENQKRHRHGPKKPKYKDKR